MTKKQKEVLDLRYNIIELDSSTEKFNISAEFILANTTPSFSGFKEKILRLSENAIDSANNNFSALISKPITVNIGKNKSIEAMIKYSNKPIISITGNYKEKLDESTIKKIVEKALTTTIETIIEKIKLMNSLSNIKMSIEV